MQAPLATGISLPTMDKAKSLFDRPDSFGWISIALHWFSALAITLLWLVGQSIASQSAEQIDARRSLHITLGLVLWLPLVARLVWRLRIKHPWVAGQGRTTHRLAKAAHYSILVVLGVSLLTGPVMVWALPEGSGFNEIAFAVHATAAEALAVLVVLHVLAALKHLMFHDDETIARIFVPRRADESD